MQTCHIRKLLLANLFSLIKQLKNNLLGLPAIKALNLLAMVESVEDKISMKYSSLFTGLGTFPETYTIKLCPEAHPYALFTPRNIPIPLCQKVHDELTWEFNEPTRWCAGVVVKGWLCPYLH